MNTGNNKKRLELYYNEITQSQDTICKNNKYNYKIDYFIDITKKHFDLNRLEQLDNKVFIMGSSVPDEIFHALNISPIWILGGNVETSLWGEQFLPKANDGMLKSTLGLLKNQEYNILKNSTVVAPINSGEMKNAAYILSHVANVIGIETPVNKFDINSKNKWLSNMWQLLENLEQISRTKLTIENLEKGVKIVNFARAQARRFISNCRNNSSIIPSTLKMFILNSYYYTDNLIEWTERISELNYEIENQIATSIIPKENKTKIMLIGSPVCFPNYKVPSMLETMGLTIESYISSDSQKMHIYSDVKRENSNLIDYLEDVLMSNYYCDCSSSFSNNIVLLEHIIDRELTKDIKGVMYHIVKGQQEQYSQISTIKEFFNTKRIPFTVLETEVGYNDGNQLYEVISRFSNEL